MSVMNRMLNEPALVSAADWRMVEAALPRLIELALEMIGEGDAHRPEEMEEGLREMTDTILERARRYREDMEKFEVAFYGELSRPEFYLGRPGLLLDRRLSLLVTGGVIDGN